MTTNENVEVIVGKMM